MSEEYPSLDIVFQEIKSKFLEQLSRSDKLTNRGNVLIGFCGFVFLFFFTVRLDLPDRLAPLSYIIFSLLLTSTISALSAIGLKIYEIPPAPRNLAENYLKVEKDKTKKQLVDNYIDAYEKNQSVLGKRALGIRVSYYTLVLSIIILTTLIFFGRVV